MTLENCPSCSSSDHRKLDSVSTHQIVEGYLSPALDVDVSGQFGDGVQAIELHECRNCGLKWYTPAVAGDGPFYVALQKQDWYYQPDKAEFGFACQHVRAGNRVLEVGCGRGSFRRFLPEVAYKGLEFNTGAVRQARELGLDVEIRDVADEAVSKPGGYDVVCHFQVLEHVPNPKAFMDSCVAALRSGGLLIVAVPAEDSFVGLAESCWLNMPPHHLTRWTDTALGHAFESVGVKPIATWNEPVSDIHKTWHAEVMLNAGLKSIFGQRPALTQSGWISRVSRRLPARSALGNALIQRGLKVFPSGRRGHTVCMVGCKE